MKYELDAKKIMYKDIIDIPDGIIMLRILPMMDVDGLSYFITYLKPIKEVKE